MAWPFGHLGVAGIPQYPVDHSNGLEIDNIHGDIVLEVLRIWVVAQPMRHYHV